MSKLIEFSNSLKKEADKIIQDTKIIKIFSPLGKVNFVGSYALDLLYRRDIDLFVQTNNLSRDKADALTKSLKESGVFESVETSNWQHGGVYWKLIYFYRWNKWKFDIWYTNEKKIVTIEKTNKILSLLKKHPKAKEEILKLKDKLYNGEKYQNNVNGFKIYEQVLGKV